MSSIYGFTITTAGRSLLAKLLGGQRLEISRIMVGSGKLPDGLNPADLTDLIAPVAQATATTPTVKGVAASFTVEYRSDLNGGLETSFMLNEFSIHAIDPDEGEILLYYATLGDYPQPVAAYQPNSIDIKRYPVSIALAAEDIEVVMTFDLNAFMTTEDIAAYIEETTLPYVLGHAQGLINAHNQSAAAHQDIRNDAAQIVARMNRVEDMILNDVTGNPFIVDFADLTGLAVEGVWNKAQQRIEF